MLFVTPKIRLPDSAYRISAVRSQGAGGQHVNKVSTAIVLQFDIGSSPLPSGVKERLLKRSDQRISESGVLTLKAQRFRSQQRNREDALQRLAALIRDCAKSRKTRIATKPTKGSQRRRLEQKKKAGQRKASRRRVTDY